MDYKSLEKYVLSKKAAIKSFPFGPDVPVFKVVNKMFALVGEQEDNLRLNLKCDPDEALILRSMYEAVIPGYHMNKVHWNTVVLNDTVPEIEVKKMIDHSYALVVKGLKKTDRESLL